MTAAHDELMHEIASLRRLPVSALRERYLELFGEETTSRNKDYLFKRIAFRMQEKKYGSLSKAARDRAKKLVEKAPTRRRPPKGASEALPQPHQRDPRLPPVGSTLARIHNGAEHQVTVLEEGFEHDGKRYKSLSQVARAITGTRWNGFLFFGLTKKKAKK